MKNYRNLTRVLVLILVVALLAACAQPAAPAPAAPAAPAAPGDAAPAPGDGADETTAAEWQEVHIGVLAPLTGPVAQFGVAVYQGLTLYIDEFNARGGLQIRFTSFDEEGNPANALTGYHSLVDQGVTAIIGSVTSGPTLAVVPIAYEDGMPMITATATHANVTVNAETGQVWSNMFRSCFIDPFQGVKMADFAAEVLGASTAAVLFSNEIDYSIGLMEAFVARAEEIGLEIVAVETFADAAVSYRSQLLNIAAQNPDVLFFPAYYRHVALMAPDAVDVGLGAYLLGADGWNGSLEVVANPADIEGAFYISGFTEESEDPMVQGFIANYTARWGMAPDMFAAQAYDAAMILIAAIEGALAEGLAPGTSEFKAATIRHMAATDLTGVTGHITFDQYNNPQKTAFIIQVRDGQDRFWGHF